MPPQIKKGQAIPLDLLEETDKPKIKKGEAIPLDLLGAKDVPSLAPPSPADREITLPEETFTVPSREEIASGLSWAGITPQDLTPVPPPKAPPPVTYEAAQGGPTIGPAQPLAEEPFYVTAARYALPKSVETRLLGPDPEDFPQYDKAKFEQELAKYRTIKPGEYEFRLAQLARPFGFIGGALAETGKLGAELGVQTAAAVTGKDAGKLREGLAESLGLPKGMATEALEPVATKKVFRALGGAEAIGETPTAEELARRQQEKQTEALFPKPSLPVRAGQDVGQAITGLLQFIATDILPILPTPEAPKTGAETFIGGVKREAGKAFERGEEFPAGTAAFAPILAKAGRETLSGDFGKAFETVAEKPATVILSALPFLHLAPNAPKVVVDLAYDTIGTALRASGGKPATWGATLGRWLSDPLQMENALKSAKAEAIYERGRTDVGAAREAVKKAVDDALRVKDTRKRFPTEAEVRRISEEGKVLETPTQLGQPEVAQALADVDTRIAEKVAKKAVEYGDNPATPTGAVLPNGKEFVRVEDAPVTDLSYDQLQQAERRLGEKQQVLQQEIDVSKSKGNTDIADTNVKVAQAQAEINNLKAGNVPDEVLMSGDPQGFVDGLIAEKQNLIRRELNRRNAKLSELEDSIIEKEAEKAKVQEKFNRTKLERSERETAAIDKTTKAIEKEAAPPTVGIFSPRGFLMRNAPDEVSIASFDTNGFRTEMSDFARQVIEQRGLEPTDKGTFRVPKEALEPDLYELSGAVTDKILDAVRNRYPVLSESAVTSEFTLGEQALSNVIATSVLDVLQDQAIAILSDSKQRNRVARALADQVSWNNARAKAQAISQLDKLLASPDISSVVIELPGINPITRNGLIDFVNKTVIGEEAVRKFGVAKAAEAAKYTERGEVPPIKEAVEDIPPQMRKAILDRVLPRMENQMMKKSMADSFAAETVEVDMSTPEGLRNGTEGVKTTIERTGTLPAAVRVGGEAQLGALINELAKTKDGQFAAEALSRYERPTATMKKLGFGEKDFIDPSINSAFTAIVDAMDKVGTYDTSVFGRLVQEAKRVYTTRNISSGLNNLKSNQLLFTAYYGLGKGIQALYGAAGELTPKTKSIFDRFLLNEPSELGAKGARELALFEGIRESGIIDNNAAQAEGLLLDTGGGIGPDLLNRAGAKGAEKALRYWNEKQDRFYSFGDNYFKFLGAIEEAGQALEVWDRVAEGETVTTNFGKYGEKVFKKLPNGDAQIIEPVYDATGKRVGERGGRILSERELTKVFAKEGARLAGDKFVDYGRVPQLQQWLRKAPAGIGGLASLFTTWYWKMADIPGLKKGIVSHFVESPSVVKSASGDFFSPARSYLRNETLKRNFGRSSLFGVAANYTNREEGEKMEQLLQRAINWEKGAMPTSSAMISNADPSQAIYLDAAGANFFGPSDIAARVLISGGMKAGELGIKGWRKVINDAADAAEVPRDVLVADIEASVLENGREQSQLYKELRRLYTEGKAGQFVSPREVATAMMLRGGGPLFDFVSVMTNPKSTMTNVEDFVNRTLLQLALGGTNKKVFIDNAYPELRAAYENASPARKKEIYADATNKLASAPFQPDRFGYPMLERFVDGVLGIGWRTAYLTQIGADGKTDLGKMGQWMKQYEDTLKQSLVREYEQKYNMLVDAGVDPSDPRVVELQKKYDYLQNVVDQQINAMNLRIDQYFVSPKVQRGPQQPIPMYDIPPPPQPKQGGK